MLCIESPIERNIAKTSSTSRVKEYRRVVPKKQSDFVKDYREKLCTPFDGDSPRSESPQLRFAGEEFNEKFFRKRRRCCSNRKEQSRGRESRWKVAILRRVRAAGNYTSN